MGRGGEKGEGRRGVILHHHIWHLALSHSISVFILMPNSFDLDVGILKHWRW